MTNLTRKKLSILTKLLIPLLLFILAIIFPTNAFAFRFVSWADTKTGTGYLSDLSNQARQLSPVFTIYAGDLEKSGFTTSGMNTWKNAMNGGSSPGNGMFDITLPVRGNHDNSDAPSWVAYFDMAAVVSGIPGATHYSFLEDDLTYSFDYENSHFVGVDVAGDIDRITTDQIGWIDSDLTAAENRGLTHAFLYWHGPLYPVSYHCCPEEPAVTAMLNNHPIVSATFHGHEHLYAYVHIDQTRISNVTHEFEQFITGNAGAEGEECPGYCHEDRLDYIMGYGKTSAVRGFVTVDVTGTTFTVNFYEQGNSTPQKTMVFTKTGVPTPTPTPTPPLHCSPLGDIDCSGKVNGLDFGYLVAHWGTSDPQANLDDTGNVGAEDALILLSNFGKTSS